MGGGLEVDLSHGAVAALWMSLPSRCRPVLQVADVRHVPDGSGLSPAPVQRYRLDLSDGVHSQPGTLAASLNHLARDGTLRRGSVVQVLDFYCDYRRRTIIVIQLQILQPECALIGSLKLYEPTRKSGGFSTRSMRYAPRLDCEPYYGGQHIDQSGIASEAEERTNCLSHHGSFGGSSLPGSGTLCSLALLAEPASLAQDEAQFTEIMEAALWRKYLFKLRIKEETFNGEQHVKSNIVGVEKLDALDVSHHLLKEIDNRLNGLSCSAPEDASSDNSNVGGASLGAGQGMQTPSHAYDGYTTGMGGSGPVCQ